VVLRCALARCPLTTVRLMWTRKRHYPARADVRANDNKPRLRHHAATNNGVRQTCCGGCDLRAYERKPELPYFGHFDFIAEFWNTLSNGPMIWIGFLRAVRLNELVDPMCSPEDMTVFNSVMLLYVLLCCAGWCSTFHHAVRWKYSIIVDWIPIAASMCFVLYGVVVLGVLHVSAISVSSWVLLTLAVSCLFTDHVCTWLPVPLGHCAWHVLAAVALDWLYADFLVDTW
jgi:hypothetical protein